MLLEIQKCGGIYRSLKTFWATLIAKSEKENFLNSLVFLVRADLTCTIKSQVGSSS